MPLLYEVPVGSQFMMMDCECIYRRTGGPYWAGGDEKHDLEFFVAGRKSGKSFLAEYHTEGLWVDLVSGCGHSNAPAHRLSPHTQVRYDPIMDVLSRGKTI